MKNTLAHIVNYVKTIFEKRIIWNVRHDVHQLRKNPRVSYDPRKLTVWKSYRILFKKYLFISFLFISQSIYVKEYFYMFFSTLKDIIQAQIKTNHYWIKWSILIICLKEISEEFFFQCLHQWQPKVPLRTRKALGGHSEGTRRALGGHSATWGT